MLGFRMFWPFATSQCLFYAFRVAKSLIQLLYDVWGLKVSGKKNVCHICVNVPLARLSLGKFKVGVSVSQLCCISQRSSFFFFHAIIMIIIIILNWKELRVMRVLHPTWAVWSLGEGQPPEELDKPIDTPPLSTLLIEKPQSATVAVGECLCRIMLKRGQGQFTCLWCH